MANKVYANENDVLALADAQLWVLDHGGEIENNIGYVLDGTRATRLDKLGWIKKSPLGIRAEMTEAGYEAIKPLTITTSFMTLMATVAREWEDDQRIIQQRNIKRAIEAMGIEVDSVVSHNYKTLEASLTVYFETHFIVRWDRVNKNYAVYPNSYKNDVRVDLATINQEADKAQMAADYINNLLEGQRNIKGAE